MASNALTAEVNEAIKAGQYTLTKSDIDTAKILVIVFACIAGVAVIIMVGVLVSKKTKENEAKKKKASKSVKSGSKASTGSGSKNTSGKSSSGNGSKKSGNKKKH